jgi:fused signal recognition particle receptor
VLAVAEQMSLPVRFIGIGERVEDLRPFEPDAFVEALL